MMLLPLRNKCLQLLASGFCALTTLRRSSPTYQLKLLVFSSFPYNFRVRITDSCAPLRDALGLAKRHQKLIRIQLTQKFFFHSCLCLPSLSRTSQILLVLMHSEQVGFVVRILEGGCSGLCEPEYKGLGWCEIRVESD